MCQRCKSFLGDKREPWDPPHGPRPCEKCAPRTALRMRFERRTHWAVAIEEPNGWVHRHMTFTLHEKLLDLAEKGGASRQAVESMLASPEAAGDITLQLSPRQLYLLKERQRPQRC